MGAGDGGRKCQRTEEKGRVLGSGLREARKEGTGQEENQQEGRRGEGREAAGAQTTELKPGAVGLFRLSSTHI